jgi:DNA-binding NarL/FixJ family response regulator
MREEADVSPAKVLVLSARRDVDGLDRNAALGVSAYRIKPVPPDLLVETIRGMLAPTPPRGAADRPPEAAGFHARAEGLRQLANQGP